MADTKPQNQRAIPDSEVSTSPDAMHQTSEQVARNVKAPTNNAVLAMVAGNQGPNAIFAFPFVMEEVNDNNMYPSGLLKTT